MMIFIIVNKNKNYQFYVIKNKIFYLFFIMSFKLLNINDTNIDTIPQIKHLFNKFIKKVIDDNNNYNVLRKLKDNNNKKYIKLINIFLEDKSIVNISSTKIEIHVENLQESLNNF